MYDAAQQHLETSAEDLQVRYYAVLALARAGAGGQAERELRDGGLQAAVDGPRGDRVNARLAEDISALRARLAKDRAMRASGPGRTLEAATAARLYEAVYRQWTSGYACINAATMWILAGERPRAQDLATAALRLAVASRPRRGQARYWQQATIAEAHLLLGNPALCSAALTRARQASPSGYGDWSATRRQLLGICDVLGIDHSVVRPLIPPAVMHYSGHMLQEGAGAGLAGNTAEMGPLMRLENAVRSRLDALDIGFAYGALACGADIIVAEAALARGAELHVVLPFDADEFRAVSVLPGGQTWGPRYDRCLELAASVSVTTDGEHLGDDVLFAHGARVAMGLALAQARFLGAPVHQLAVWDSSDGNAVAGTHVDLEAWRGTGHTTDVVVLPRGARRLRRPAPRPRSPRPGTGRRTLAMLFGDIRGFGRLSDRVMPNFVDGVLGPLGQVLHQHRLMDLSLSSSGDGFFAAFGDVGAAAECALQLQHRFSGLRLEDLGLPPFLGLRIGGHVGAVYELTDPISEKTNYYGLQVTRTARIEPRTPEGEVYVTAAFAALVELGGNRGFACEYVGHMPTAKEHGVLPMYVLKRIHRGSNAG